MTCEELRDEYGAYALGAAGEPERSEIAAHVARGCEECLPGVRDAMQTVASMSGAVKLVDPPKRLRRRVIAMVRPGSGSVRWGQWVSWAALAAAAVALFFVYPSRTSPDTAKLENALSILNDPGTKDVSFGDPAARGRVFVSPGKGVVLIAAHLPKLESGKTFELWVIPNGGKPVPAGTFGASSDSTAVYVHNGAVNNAAAVAVTVEPEGGSPQPTSTPFIVTKL